MHVLISGGSGLLGSTLARRLCAKEIAVTILSRTPELVHLPRGARAVKWDAKSTAEWPEKLKPIDAVVNLCGESLAGKGLLTKSWTDAHKQKVRNSRLESSAALCEWIEQSRTKPKIFIQQSGIDYYQYSRAQTDEHGEKGSGFLSQLAQDWEASTAALDTTDMRYITTRTSPVLHPDKPPLLQWLWATQSLLGGVAGNGRQYLSWIHVGDYADIVTQMLTQDDFHGTYNLCAPNPLMYEDAMLALGKVLNRPIWLPQPKKLLQSIMGEASTMALDSRRVIPKRLTEEHQVKFTYPTFAEAVTQLTKI